MKIVVLINVFLIIANIVFFSKAHYFAKLIGLFDKPDNIRKIHTISVPLLGGISLIFSIFINLVTFLSLKIINLEIFLAYFISIFSFFVLGFIDDYKNINPKIKILFSIIFLTIFVLVFKRYIVYELSFSSFNKIISLGIFSIPFTILCFMLLQNAINMIDGIDGLLSISTISILFICLIYNVNSDIFINYLIFTVIINLFIFTAFNIKKKTFMGDSGSFVIAILLGLIIIDAYNMNAISYFKISLKVEQIFMILMLPGIDMFRVFLLRISLGKNPFLPDNNHLHHYLLKFFNKYWVCLIYLTLILASNLMINFFPEKTLLVLITTLALYFSLLFFSYKKSVSN